MPKPELAVSSNPASAAAGSADAKTQADTAAPASTATAAAPADKKQVANPTDSKAQENATVLARLKGYIQKYTEYLENNDWLEKFNHDEFNRDYKLHNQFELSEEEINKLRKIYDAIGQYKEFIDVFNKPNAINFSFTDYHEKLTAYGSKSMFGELRDLGFYIDLAYLRIKPMAQTTLAREEEFAKNCAKGKTAYQVEPLLLNLSKYKNDYYMKGEGILVEASFKRSYKINTFLASGVVLNIQQFMRYSRLLPPGRSKEVQLTNTNIIVDEKIINDAKFLPDDSVTTFNINYSVIDSLNILRLFPNATTICLENCDIKDFAVHLLPNPSRLTHLSLEFSKINNLALDVLLKRCSNLTYLNLKGCLSGTTNHFQQLATYLANSRTLRKLVINVVIKEGDKQKFIDAIKSNIYLPHIDYGKGYDFNWYELDQLNLRNELILGLMGFSPVLQSEITEKNIDSILVHLCNGYKIITRLFAFGDLSYLRIDTKNPDSPFDLNDFKKQCLQKYQALFTFYLTKIKSDNQDSYEYLIEKVRSVLSDAPVALRASLITQALNHIRTIMTGENIEYFCTKMREKYRFHTEDFSELLGQHTLGLHNDRDGITPDNYRDMANSILDAKSTTLKPSQYAYKIIIQQLKVKLPDPLVSKWLTTFITHNIVITEKDFERRIKLIDDYTKSNKVIDSSVYDAVIDLCEYYNKTTALQNDKYDQIFKDILGAIPLADPHVTKAQMILVPVYRKQLFAIFAKVNHITDFSQAIFQEGPIKTFQTQANRAMTLLSLKVALGTYWDSFNSIFKLFTSDKPNQSNKELFAIKGELFKLAKEVKVTTDMFDEKVKNQTAAELPKASAPVDPLVSASAPDAKDVKFDPTTKTTASATATAAAMPDSSTSRVYPSLEKFKLLTTMVGPNAPVKTPAAAKALSKPKTPIEQKIEEIKKEFDTFNANDGRFEKYMDKVHLGLMIDPVMIIASGKTYDRVTVKDHFKTRINNKLKLTDPYSGEELADDKICLNQAIQDLILDELDKYRLEKRAEREKQKVLAGGAAPVPAYESIEPNQVTGYVPIAPDEVISAAGVLIIGTTRPVVSAGAAVESVATVKSVPVAAASNPIANKKRLALV